MREYTYTEIGMLLGLAIGGVLAVIGYAMVSSAFVFILAAAGLFAGRCVGRFLEKKP